MMKDYRRYHYDENKLIEYGFKKQEYNYIYETDILDGDFRIEVIINDTLDAKVYDTDLRVNILHQQMILYRGNVEKYRQNLKSLLIQQIQNILQLKQKFQRLTKILIHIKQK